LKVEGEAAAWGDFVVDGSEMPASPAGYGSEMPLPADVEQAGMRLFQPLEMQREVHAVLDTVDALHRR
jgi:hypothetical protein